MSADLPDTLPPLLALWAERHPDEIIAKGAEGAMLPAYTLGEPVYSTLHALPSGLGHRGVWAIEGHARACIERAGWTWCASYPRDPVRPERAYVISGWGPDGEFVSAAGPSLAVALVRLRLSLPAPADR